MTKQELPRIAQNPGLGGHLAEVLGITAARSSILGWDSTQVQTKILIEGRPIVQDRGEYLLPHEQVMVDFSPLLSLLATEPALIKLDSYDEELLADIKTALISMNAKPEKVKTLIVRPNHVEETGLSREERRLLFNYHADIAALEGNPLTVTFEEVESARGSNNENQSLLGAISTFAKMNYSMANQQPVVA